MRLEYLCTLKFTYDSEGLTLVRPFAGHEAQAFGTGTGQAEGERLSGQIRWGNYPRMTDDGVFMPDLRGLIATDDGPVLFELHGYSLRPIPGTTERAVTGVVGFRTESDTHRWLNTAVAVHEGKIDSATMSAEFPTYVGVPTMHA